MDFDLLRVDMKEVDHLLRWRDVLLIGLLGLGVGLQVVFGWLTQPVVDPLSEAGIVVFAAATAALCAVLLFARRLEPADDWTLRARLRREIDKLGKQLRLAESVAVWLLLPMAAAIVLGSLGGHHARTGSYVPNARLLAYYAVGAAIYVATWWWSRHDARRRYGPLLARLRRLSAELEEDG